MSDEPTERGGKTGLGDRELLDKLRRDEAFDEVAANDAEVFVEEIDVSHADPHFGPKRGPGWGAVALTGLVAALAGAGSGWALSQMDEAEPVSAVSPQELSALATRVDGLETRDVGSELRGDVRALETRLESIVEDSTGGANAEAVDVSALETRLQDRLDALEDQLGSVGTVESSETTPMRDRQLNSGSPRPALTPELARRLAKLETRLDTIEKAGVSVPVTTPNISFDREASASADPVRASVTAPIPAFPFEAVEAAMDEGSGRVLSRFVKVRDAGAVRALDDLRDAIEMGDRKAALSAYNDLPERAQEAAARWAAQMGAN